MFDETLSFFLTRHLLIVDIHWGAIKGLGGWRGGGGGRERLYGSRIREAQY